MSGSAASARRDPTTRSNARLIARFHGRSRLLGTLRSSARSSIRPSTSTPSTGASARSGTIRMFSVTPRRRSTRRRNSARSSWGMARITSRAPHAAARSGALLGSATTSTTSYPSVRCRRNAPTRVRASAPSPTRTAGLRHSPIVKSASLTAPRISGSATSNTAQARTTTGREASPPILAADRMAKIRTAPAVAPMRQRRTSSQYGSRRVYRPA